MTSRAGMGGALLVSVSLAVACATTPPQAAGPAVVASQPPAVSVAVAPAPTGTAVVGTGAPPGPLDAGAAKEPDPPLPAGGERMNAWKDQWPQGWTDPRVVAKLAQRCDFVPVAPPPDEPMGAGTPADVFTCTLELDQACMKDDCYDEIELCRSGCESQCSSCAQACTAACVPCEAACTTEACKHACAATTASCKQSCNRTMDRCDTGACTNFAKTCEDGLRHAWGSHHCDAKCGVYQKCTDGCRKSSGADEAALKRCDDACDTAMAPGNTACRAKCDAGREGDQARCRRKCDESFPCSPLGCF